MNENCFLIKELTRRNIIPGVVIPAKLESRLLLWAEVTATHSLAEKQTPGHQQTDTAWRSWAEGAREGRCRKAVQPHSWCGQPISYGYVTKQIPHWPPGHRGLLQLVGSEHTGQGLPLPSNGAAAQSHSVATLLWNLHQSHPFGASTGNPPHFPTNHTPPLSFQIQFSNKLFQGFT